jgi:diaminopimelate epimerase
MSQTFPFIKACGLGNDFVIVDTKALRADLDLKNLSLLLANRRQGVGCDQVIYPFSTEDKHTYKVRFFNADGSEAESCGNGSRCVAKLLMQSHNVQEIELQTLGGNLKCQLLPNGYVSLAFPKPHYKTSISLHPHAITSIPAAVYVNIGNPHLVCFVDDMTAFEKWGPLLETHLYGIDHTYPKRANVGFVQVINNSSILLNVWERGVGYTHACGTGACAAAIAAHAYGLVGKTVLVNQNGGPLTVKLNNTELFLQGEATLVYKGEFILSKKTNIII